jgi:hypothetical protein
LVTDRPTFNYDNSGNPLPTEKAAEVAHLTKVLRALDGGISEVKSFTQNADGQWVEQPISE